MIVQAVTPSASAPGRLLAPVSQRERLLDGMARAVARCGYAATPVAAVLEVAGVSRRTFYEQFADKEDCFLAAYDMMASLCATRVASARRAADQRDEVVRILDALLGTLAAEPDFAHLAVVDVLGAGPRALARRELALRWLERLIIDVADGQPPSATVRRAIVGAIHEVVHAVIAGSQTARLPALADELAELTASMLSAARRIG